MLVREVIGLLITDPDGIYVDATVGSGGHAEAILEALSSGGQLIGLDRDPAAIDAAARHLQRFGRRVQLVNARASRLTPVLADCGIEKVNGVLLDLGLSSDQLASARGFSFEREGPLDLRFDPREDRPPAHELLAHMDRAALADLLVRYGEFTAREARRYASRLVAVRDAQGLRRVEQLRAALTPLIPPQRRARTLARIFQALRIVTNDELVEVGLALEAATENLRSNAILCVISYHSLEDRLVKQFMAPPAPPRRDLPPPPAWPEPRYQPLTRRPVRPDAEEIGVNPRSRSARLRAARRR